jgi:DDE family transposase
MFLPFTQKNFCPLPKGIKNSKKLSHDEWLNTKSGIGAALVVEISERFQCQVLTVCDSWFGTEPLLKEARNQSEFQIDLLSRLRINSALFELPSKETKVRKGCKRKYGERLPATKELAEQLKKDAETDRIHIYGKDRDCTFSQMRCMSRALKCKIKVIFIYRGSYVFPIFTTDLTLTAQQMIEYYSARRKIESGFKELKHEIGILDSQCRNKQAVENHFNLGCYAMSLTWIYALQSEKAPARMHPTRRSNAFAFADVRRRIATEIKNDVLNRGCSKTVIPAIKSICACIFRIGA